MAHGGDIPRVRIVVLPFALVLGCAADSAAMDPDESEGQGASESGVDDPPTDAPPTDGDALQSWLERGDYRAWAAESGVHPSSGPHGSSGVRTFLSAALFTSFMAEAAEHPIGSAVVKELYSGAAISGWAVMVKVEAGRGGDGWYWFERVGSSTYADGVGERLCTGCHGAGADQVLTPWPLQ